MEQFGQVDLVHIDGFDKMDPCKRTLRVFYMGPFRPSVLPCLVESIFSLSHSTSGQPGNLFLNR